MSGRVSLLVLIGTLLLAAQSVRADDSGISGLWREVGATLIRCQGCLSVVRHGTVLTVVSEAGWSAVVTANSYRPTSYASGTGRWRPNIGAKQADEPFEVHLSLADSRLVVVLMKESDHGASPHVKVNYERRLPALDKSFGKVRKIKISEE